MFAIENKGLEGRRRLAFEKAKFACLHRFFFDVFNCFPAKSDIRSEAALPEREEIGV